MPAGDDDTFLKFDFSAGADYPAGSRSRHVAALPYRGDDADGTGIGEGQFHLVLGTHRAENRTFEAGLGAYHLDLLVRSILAGL